MSEYTTITDHPFPIVREIALSNYKRGQIIRLLQNVKAEVILSDTLALGDLRRSLSLLSCHENSPSVFMDLDFYRSSMTASAFASSRELGVFQKAKNFIKYIHIGHPTDFTSFSGTIFPHFRIVTDLFFDSNRRPCVAEIGFIPVAEAKTKSYFTINNTYFPQENSFSNSKYDTLWNHLAEVTTLFPVFTNAFNNEPFFIASWPGDERLGLGEHSDELHSAIVTPSLVFPEGSFTMVTEQQGNSHE